MVKKTEIRKKNMAFTSIFSLQWFMDRIARHPLLQASPYTRIFLESTDFVN